MNFIPIFEHGLILKQHMLEAIRDYPIEYVDTIFADYEDGVLSGLNVNVCEDNCFVITKGIVKINGKVYFVNQSEKIKFCEHKNYVYLNIIEEKSVDGCNYKSEFRQTNNKDKSSFELFRYVKNADMKRYGNIEELFDEVTNRIDQRNMRRSLSGGYSMINDYYVLFAKRILQGTNAEMKDIAFAYQCLNGITDIEIIKVYFGLADIDNGSVIEAMKSILERINNEYVEEKSEPDAYHEPEQVRVYI